MTNGELGRNDATTQRGSIHVLIGAPTAGSRRSPWPGPGRLPHGYTALLAGENFSDHPRCTHQALADLARQVNDLVSHDARQRLVTRAPALAAISANQGGVAAAVADAVMHAHWQHAPFAVFLLSRTRRAAALSERDTAGPRWWTRTRNLLAAHNIVYGGLRSIEHSIQNRDAKDGILLGVLDQALARCAQRQPAECPSPSSTRVS